MAFAYALCLNHGGRVARRKTKIRRPRVESLEQRTLLTAAPTLLRDPSPAGLFVEAGSNTFFTESGNRLYVTNGTSGGTFFLKSFDKVAGMTAVGDIGESCRDYTAIGPVVNLAARLQGAAQAGQVLVTDAVYASVADRFPRAEAQSLALKGIEKPVRAYALSA